MNRLGNGKMGRVAVEVKLTNYRDKIMAEEGTLAADQIRQVLISGVVDSGASYLVLPKKVADQLGLASAGKATVRYADRRQATRAVVKNVEVELQGRQGVFKAIVEPKRDDVLIGAIVLEDLDLLVDCRTQALLPRDPHRIIAEIE